MTLSTVLNALLDTVLDCLKIIPLLYLTYLLLEFIEKKASSRLEGVLDKAGKIGPIWGSLLGLIPQCGFSSAAASFYAARTITMGTLIAVFMATSDEMLPILLSSRIPVTTILIILGIKLISGIVVGFSVDLFARFTGKKTGPVIEAGDSADTSHEQHEEIHDLCERVHCKCHEGQNIFLSALRHTAWISGMLFAVSLILSLLMQWLGEERLSMIFTNRPVLGEVIAALVGLIPNCSASVLISDLFVNGLIGMGPLVSGLLVNAGVGLLVLFRTNRPMHKNLIVVAITFLSSIIIGSIVGLFL